jgi:3-hydroxyacyl-CoA dehydrogenase
MVKGNFATAYDAVVAGKIAHIVTGGNVPRNALVTEEYLKRIGKRSIFKPAWRRKDYCKN